MNAANSTDIANSIGAGFAATIALSAIMLKEQAMELMPELNPVQTQIAASRTWSACPTAV